MAPEPPVTVVLDGASRDVGLLGGKGAALDALVAEFPVPPTGVVTSAAYRRYAADPTLTAVTARIMAGDVVAADEIDAAFLALDMAPELADAICALARDIGGDGELSVRSSATVEDMAGSSFAGQYRSLLGIDATDRSAVLDAVRLVLASLWHPAPCAYRRTFEISDEDAAMAVVLMKMVPAARAGVAFTVDPAGTENAARVEAVHGLGEALVSGERTPDAWVLDRDRPDPGLPAEAAAALQLSLDVEAVAGTPQDIEWAWDGDRIWLLQARPITVTEDGDGFDSHPGDHDLTVAGIAEMLPGVLPPLLWELDGHMIDEAFRRVLDDLGVLPVDMELSHLIRRVRGRAALDFSRLQRMADDLPGNAAEHLEEQYFGSRRTGRSAAPSGDRPSRLSSIRHDYRVLRARRRNAMEGEIAIEAVAELVADPMELGPKPDRDVLSYRLGLVELAIRTAGAELGVAADAVAAYRRIELVLIPHLGEDEAGREAAQVTSGRGIAVEPELDASASVFGGPTWRELGRQPPALPTTRHDVEPLEALQDRLSQQPSWGGQTLRSAIRAQALRHTVADAVTQLRRREQLKATLLRLGGEIRRVHLEIGRRLVASGILREPGDIELLTTAEIIGAPQGRAPSRAEIGRRRRWRTRYEGEPPLPARFSGQPESVDIELPPGGRLDGWAASGGRFTGIARVVTSPDGPLEDGEILVTQATDGTWSPLFGRAGAIVLERGGPLSHAAILARELGVPAVLNVAGASHHLDGCRLTVDGDAGVVVLHDAAGTDASSATSPEPVS